MKLEKLLCGAAGVALIYGAPAAAQDLDIEVDESREESVILPVARIDMRDFLITVTRDRSRFRIDNFTGSATVIERGDIRNRQVREIADVLRDVPGVAVASTPGQTQIRLRGTEANHVLVLVDGIEVSDPGSGEFDIGTLQAEIGSRVEVLRGPQSALYGNDAIGGVVAYDSNVFSGFAARIEGGTDDTINGAARFGHDGGDWNLALSATVVSTDGEPNARGGVRDIGRDSYTLSGKGAIEVAEGLNVRAVLRHVLTEGDFNDQDFGFGSPTLGLVIDTPGVGFENEAIYGLLGARLDAMDGDWTHDLSVQFADSDRNTFDPDGLTSDTESDRFKASYITAYNFGRGEHTVTFAADYEVEGFNNAFTFDDRNEVENVGFVGEYRYTGNRFDFAAALRHDVNDLFEDATTFRVGAGVNLTNTTRVRAAIGSGVKNPTLNELFGFFDGMFIGNPDLDPEKSTSWEIGLDQEIDALRLSLTYFDSELENEIFTTFPPPDFIATPGNRTTDSTQRGVEVSIGGELGAGFSFDAAYTYLDAEEDEIEEVRRPGSIASAALNWTAPSDTVSATLVVRHNGEAVDVAFTDPSFTPVRVTLDDYTLVNINARVKLAESMEVFGRVENLLDETYEQVFSFVSPGRSIVAGIRARF